LGLPVAAKAMAAKLDRLLYRIAALRNEIWTKEPNYMRPNTANSRSSHLKRKAAQLGLQIIEVADAA
jgi:hypothetical protein